LDTERLLGVDRDVTNFQAAQFRTCKKDAYWDLLQIDEDQFRDEWSNQGSPEAQPEFWVVEKLGAWVVITVVARIVAGVVAEN